VILPASNTGDLEVLPDEVREGIRFQLARTMDEVLEAALVTDPSARVDSSTRELLDGTADPGVQLSQ
jgi:ATP-dependent Lon protease